MTKMKKYFIILSIFFCISKATVIQKGSKIKVCVIGAGPAGISTTRYLSQHLNSFDITVFERAYQVGGQWLYNEKTGIDDDGYPVHSSVYKYLRTSNVRELMTYPDWQVFKESDSSFVSHSVILDYLKDYTDHFQLRQYIQFNSIVLNVSLITSSGQEQWEVTVNNSKTSKISKSVFDAVIVCNGYFSIPYIPKIPGLDDFKGTVLHSHSYREPELYQNKSVIILGAAVSGRDIGLQLLNFSSKVYLSHNKAKLSIKGLIQIKGIDKYENGKFVLKDNTTISADVLLICTGYWYSYPFLNNNTGIKIDDDHSVYPYPLYKHILNIEHPSMSFIGIRRSHVPKFPNYSIEVQYIIAVLTGRVQLPSKSEMLKNAESHKAKKLYSDSEMWKYYDDLATMGGFSINETIWYRDLTKFVNARYLKHLDYRLMISNDKKSFKFVKV